MFNFLVMNMEKNLIIDAFQGVDDETITDIKYQYRHPEFKVMLVCSTIFSKWKRLDKRSHGNGHVPINHLLRISHAYRDAIKHISKRQRKWNYNEDDNVACAHAIH